MKGEGRTGEARRAVRLRISDLTPCGREKKGRKVRWKCLRRQCSFQRVQQGPSGVLEPKLACHRNPTSARNMPALVFLPYSFTGWEPMGYGSLPLLTVRGLKRAFSWLSVYFLCCTELPHTNSENRSSTMGLFS